MSGRDASVVGYRLRHLTLLGASLISVIATTAVSASLPAMSSHFAATTGDRFWVRLTLTLPALTTALFGPVVGAVIDRCGHRTVLVASLLAYASAGMYGPLAGSLTSLMISRLLFGVAVAGVLTSATALLSDSAHDTNLDRYMGRQSMFMGLGSVVFLSLGGLLAQVDWRYPFLLYAVALLLLPGVVLLVQEPSRWSNSEGSDLWQPRHIAARSGPPSAVCLLAFISMALYFLVPVGLPFLLLSFPGHSESRTGVMLGAVGTAWIVSSAAYHRLRRRCTCAQVLVWSFAVMGVGHLVLSSATSHRTALVALVLIGLGLGAAVPNFSVWMLTSVPPALAGGAIGQLVLWAGLGQFFSPVVSRPLTDAHGPALTFAVGGFVLLVVAFAGAVRPYKADLVRLLLRSEAR